MPRAEQVTDPVAFHGEGPIWCDDRLHWVDMLAGDVLSMGSDRAVSRRHVSGVVAALRPRRSGGFVHATERGFVLTDASGTASTVPDVWADPGVRFNDGGCDPDGRFYCGTMAYDERAGAGSMFRLDPDGSVRQVFTDVSISNGLDWSPDGTQAYYIDTPTRRVDVFDYTVADGLVRRRPFVTVTGGFPDGLTVDAEGGVWVALWGGSAVHRYGPDAALTEVVELPVTQPTSCALGGPDLRTLFVTTSRQHLAADEQPAAGAIFALDVGVDGRPVRAFAG